MSQTQKGFLRCIDENGGGPGVRLRKRRNHNLNSGYRVTVCIAVQVNDGLIFAADSAVTSSYGTAPSGAEIIRAIRHGRKVFNLHRDLPICAMTCGLDHIGPDSIGSLAQDLRIVLMGKNKKYALDPANYTIDEVAAKARKFLFEEKFAALVQKPKAEMSFYVGGYSSGASQPERWLVKIRGEANDSPEPECLSKTTGLSWGGEPDAIFRLVMGVGLNHRAALFEAGLSREQVDAASAALQTHLQFRYVHGDLSVQDAIDFADFLVEATKSFVRFLRGTDVVGGETDIAVVTKPKGFKLIHRKHYVTTTGLSL